MRMLIRSMAPQVVAADELGTAADVLALEEALQSGVYPKTSNLAPRREIPEAVPPPSPPKHNGKTAAT